MAVNGRDEYSRKFWLEFIQLYKEHPCIWDTRCNEYTDQTYKDLAFNTLLEKYWELKPTATLENLKKKIRTLRSGVLREYKKIEEARMVNRIYKPKLWYYHQLKFFRPELGDLEDEDKPDFESDFKSPCSDREHITDDYPEIPIVFPTTHLQAPLHYQGLPVISTVSTITDTENLNARPSTSRGLAPLAPTNYVIQKISEDGLEESEEDDCSTFAAHIKTRMRKFDPAQKMLAQKLISDIMFMADTRQLHMTTAIFNPHYAAYHFSGYPVHHISSLTPAPQDLRNGKTDGPSYVIDSDDEDQSQLAKKRK